MTKFYSSFCSGSPFMRAWGVSVRPKFFSWIIRTLSTSTNFYGVFCTGPPSMRAWEVSIWPKFSVGQSGHFPCPKEGLFSICSKLAISLVDKKKLPDGAMMAPEDNKEEIGILCKLNGNSVLTGWNRKSGLSYYLQRSYVCSRKCSFYPGVLFKFQPVDPRILFFNV